MDGNKTNETDRQIATQASANIIYYFAALGLISGLASAFMPEWLSAIHIFETPVFPGIAFGLVLAFALSRWGGAAMVTWVALPVAATLAWIAAVNLFFVISGDAKDNVFFGEICAGIVGAAGVAAACMALSPPMRRTAEILLVIAAGAAAGLLTDPAAQLSQNLILLFTVWQASVAAAIGYVLYRGQA